MIIVDTNVISECMKPVPYPPVLAWLGAQEVESLYSTTITLAEILSGVESMPQGRRRRELLASVEISFETWFKDRVLAFDGAAARAYARIIASRKRAGRPTATLDAMIAGIAQRNGAAVATRNVYHFQECGVEVINPWDD